MTNSNCTGIIHVKEYIRNGFQVEAYDRKCGRHNPNIQQTSALADGANSIAAGIESQSQSGGNNFTMDPTAMEFMKLILAAINAFDEDNMEAYIDLCTDVFWTTMKFEGIGSETMADGPYFDTEGNATIGYGTNIQDEKKFMGVNFRKSDGTLLTATEKAKLYVDIKGAKMPSQYKIKAQKQKIYSWAKIDQAEADRLAQNDIVISLKEVRNSVGKDRNGYIFDALPKPAQEVVLDMHYNMGSAKFNDKKWPKFFDAIRTRDFEKAAYQSHGSEIPESRNRWRSDKLYEALEEEKRLR